MTPRAVSAMTHFKRTLVDVAHMHLNVREFYRTHAVAQRIASVHETRRVHEQAVYAFACGVVKPPDCLALDRAVENIQGHTTVLGVMQHYLVEFRGCGGAVNLRLALA